MRVESSPMPWPKPKTTLVFLVVVATGLAILGVALAYRYGCMKATVDANLKYTEQIDFLLKVIVSRHEQGDSDVLIFNDLRDLSVNYSCSYEGQPFGQLVGRFLGRAVLPSDLAYSSPEPARFSKFLKATDANRDLWTLPPQPDSPPPRSPPP